MVTFNCLTPNAAPTRSCCLHGRAVRASHGCLAPPAFPPATRGRMAVWARPCMTVSPHCCIARSHACVAAWPPRMATWLQDRMVACLPSTAA
eukprot:126986-Chlamydomonas_euryale.AAC.13